jgi:hypothetical protein
MADERIDIEINDKIDANIPKKLRDIASSADKGESSVKRLKAALADINATPAQRLKAATDDVTNSLNREVNAQKSVKTARDATSSAIAKEAAQRDRISAMVDRSIAQMEREAAARRAAMSASGPIGGGDGLAGSRAAAARQTADMRAETDRLATARRNDAAAARVQEAATEASTGAMRRNSAAAGMNRQHMLNLGFQLQDIVVGLTSGQKPLTVFLQQGAQIQGIMGQAGIGVGGLAQAVWKLIAPFAAFIAIAGVAAAALALFKSDLNDGNDMKEFAKTLGLTKKEMEDLKDVTITWGDMWEGFKKTLADNTKIDEAWTATKNWLIQAFRDVLKFGMYAVAGLYGSFVGAYRAIKKTWQDFPALLGYLFTSGVNVAIDAIESLVNASIQGINWLTDKANGVLPDMAQIGRISEVRLGRIAVAGQDAAQRVGDAFREEVGGATREAFDGMNNFLDEWGRNSAEAARDRLRAQAQDIIGDRGAGPKGKEDKTAENRAKALRMVNLELDNELARMKMLKPEREIQQRMDQITQQLAQKGITLSDTETAAIRAKIAAIQDYAYVQSEADRILEAATAPQRTYNATLQAASELLAQGAIDQARFNAEVVLAGRALQEATNPFFAMTEAMTQAEGASLRYGVAAQKSAYYESLRQAALAKGIELSPTYVAGVNAEVDALMRRNDALLQQQFIQSQVASFVDPLLQDQTMLENKANLYAEIDRLRQADVLSEENAQRAKYALDAKYSEMRLAGASSFFGELASLSSSGNKKLAAIGKAAAIAQATIDGFVAVQKALASAPPPWNFAMAAAVAVKTGVQVAGIMSTNVGSYANGGSFMVDGNAGVDRNNINMNVSKGERVTIETPAQQRANDNGAGGDASGLNLKIVNQFDAREFVAEVTESDEFEHAVLNVMSRNPNAVKSAANN